MKLIIGIDFGTNTTVVRYKWEGSDTISPIKDSDGNSDIIPSVIFKPTKGAQLYGKVALSRYNGGEEGELICNFKMGLTSSDPNKLSESKERIKEFLSYVCSCFTSQTMGLDTTDCDVYVSYPAKWPSSLANYMKEVVKEAGFPGKVHGLFEPVAAVQNALKKHVKHLKSGGLLTANKPLNILMLDMGAGTSDIYIFKLNLENVNGKSIVSIVPDSGTSYPSVDDTTLCGGREIDEMLHAHVLGHLKKTLTVFDDDEISDIFKVSDAKNWKDEHLSNTLKSETMAGLPSKVLGSLAPMKKFIPKTQFEAAQAFSINRASFEDCTKSHWSSLYNMIESAISLHKSRTGIGAEDVDLILLTGGHSAWYTVSKLFNGDGISGQIGIDHVKDGKENKATHFAKIENEPCRILTDALPHESVARGLVLHPEGVAIPVSSSNNVWIQMRINEKQSELVEVVSIGTNLPYKTNEGELTISFNDQRFDHVYDLYIDVYTGKTKETAEVWTSHNHFDDRVGAIVANIIFVGLPTIFGGFDYNFNLKYHFTIEEDGCVHFESKLQKDDEDPIEIKF